MDNLELINQSVYVGDGICLSLTLPFIFFQFSFKHQLFSVFCEPFRTLEMQICSRRSGRDKRFVYFPV